MPAHALERRQSGGRALRFTAQEAMRQAPESSRDARQISQVATAENGNAAYRPRAPHCAIICVRESLRGLRLRPLRIAAWAAQPIAEHSATSSCENLHGFGCALARRGTAGATNRPGALHCAVICVRESLLSFRFRPAFIALRQTQPAGQTLRIAPYSAHWINCAVCGCGSRAFGTAGTPRWPSASHCIVLRARDSLRICGCGSRLSQRGQRSQPATRSALRSNLCMGEPAQFTAAALAYISVGSSANRPNAPHHHPMRAYTTHGRCPHATQHLQHGKPGLQSTPLRTNQGRGAAHRGPGRIRTSAPYDRVDAR